jgi:NAD(P)-dependent dehydrogenase (short-subunit alcohol dehydrogenase family)
MESVLITGANRGIGKALAEEFLSHGWHVFAAMRDPAKSNFSPAIKDNASKIEILQLDITSEDSVTAAAETVRQAVRQLNVLINNAGVFPEEGNERLVDMKLEWFQEAFETNVIGVARMIQHFRPLLLAGSRIANISSALASISSKESSGYYAYSVSKSALNMLTRTIAAEFAPDKIVVTALSPGWVRTDMGGATAPLSPQESARSLFQTITKLKLNQSGAFLGRDGASMAF